MDNSIQLLTRYEDNISVPPRPDKYQLALAILLFLFCQNLRNIN